MIEAGATRCAILSTDGGFRSTAAEVFRRPGRNLQVALELTVPFTQLGDEQLAQLRAADPELVVLDLEVDPVLGLKFAQFLADQSPHRRIMAVGPMLSSEQLLAALRAGISEYLPKPVASEAFGSALDAVLRRLRWSPHAGPAQPGELVAVFSPKGGSGSTTVATNLAIHLHRLTGKRTLLLDLDLELGEIALQLGVEPRFNFIDMVRNFHRMDADLLASFIEHHTSGVHVLSAPYHPERAELVSGEQIAKILNFLKQHYAYVVVDTSKSFSATTLATFERADRILLVTVADLPSLRNITRCLPLLKQVVGPAEDRVHLVLNRYQEEDPIGIADIEKTLDMKVYWTIANDYDAVVTSVNSGVPVILGGASDYARDLKGLGARIAGIGTGDEETSERTTSLVRPLTQLWKRALGQQAEVKA